MCLRSFYFYTLYNNFLKPSSSASNFIFSDFNSLLCVSSCFFSMCVLFFLSLWAAQTQFSCGLCPWSTTTLQHRTTLLQQGLLFLYKNIYYCKSFNFYGTRFSFSLAKTIMFAIFIEVFGVKVMNKSWIVYVINAQIHVVYVIKL